MIGLFLPRGEYFFVYCTAVLFFAYFIRGIAGFGSALIAVPLLSLRLPLVAVVPLVSLLDYIASASQGLRQRRLIRWRDLLPLAPFTLLGAAVGLYLLKSLEAATLARMLGIFICAYAVYMQLPLPKIARSRRWAAPAGAMGGLVGILFGTGGPFYVMYLTLRQVGKAEFRPTVAMIFMLDGAVRLTGYVAGGFLTLQAVFVLLVCLPVLAAGLWLGGRIHLALSQAWFTRIVSLILLASGMLLVVKFF